MIARNYNIIKELSAGYSLFITGPRGSGKSLFIRSLLKDNFANSLTLDFLSRDIFKKYSKGYSLHCLY